jgi:hypothetical protein
MESVPHNCAFLDRVFKWYGYAGPTLVTICFRPCFDFLVPWLWRRVSGAWGCALLERRSKDFGQPTMLTVLPQKRCGVARNPFRPVLLN